MPTDEPSPLPHSQFYGRRTARPLRPARAEALARALPLYRIELDENERLPLLTRASSSSAKAEDPPQNETQVAGDPRVQPEDDIPVFVDKTAIWLEIGFGGGEHLLEQARRHPDIGLIGCEPFVGGVSTLVMQLEALKVENVRVFTEDARFLLKTLPNRSIARCFVLFADPWPKKRHNKRRIVNPETLTDLARILREDGELFIATDDPDLAQWYEEVVAEHPAFTLHAAFGDDPRHRPADWPETRYEQKAIAAGRAPRYYRVIPNR